MSADRTFTVEQAEILLPQVRHQLELMREALAWLRKSSARLAPGEASSAELEPSPVHEAALRQLATAQRRLEEAGVELKDVDRGLVDFPSVHGGRPILLCWLEGEPTVGWYHERETGFSGRRPLADLT